jgi:hypothetical protein
MLDAAQRLLPMIKFRLSYIPAVEGVGVKPI